MTLATASAAAAAAEFVVVGGGGVVWVAKYSNLTLVGGENNCQKEMDFFLAARLNRDSKQFTSTLSLSARPSWKESAKVTQQQTEAALFLQQ